MSQRRSGMKAGLESALRAELFREIVSQGSVRIAAVWPLAGEVDLRPLCHDLVGAGKQVLLPETPPKGQPLVFRRWSPSAIMHSGRFGTTYPEGAVETPDLVLVPLLAFDRAGYRLGYGGGYYDRTLAVLRVPAIGYGFSAQELPGVPVGPYDIPLSMIITEHGPIRIAP